jgi:hypothetical protein
LKTKEEKKPLFGSNEIKFLKENYFFQDFIFDNMRIKTKRMREKENS